MAVERMAGQQIGDRALLALLGAITGVVMIFVGNPGWGLFVAVCAAVLAAIGFFLSASPRVSGGVMRISAIIMAMFGIDFSVLG